MNSIRHFAMLALILCFGSAYSFGEMVLEVDSSLKGFIFFKWASRGFSCKVLPFVLIEIEMKWGHWVFQF